MQSKHLNLSAASLVLILIILTSNYLAVAYAQTSATSTSTVNISNQYTILQATSNQAQLNTIAFSGLGFLTGNLTTDSFLPPGKVADFFGFQYLRDTSQAGQGHATDFLTNAANNVLFILNSDQKAQMINTAENQTDLVNQYAYARYPLMTAFRRELNGSLPSNSNSLNEDAIISYSANLFELDANISITRALLYAQIINSLNSTQQHYLDNMATGGFESWPVLPDQLNKTSLNHDAEVLVMTYASDIFAWYSGNVTSDTYFCPERQADYFGGFYLKDAPAMGRPDYTISETITGDSGEAFLATLDASQNALMTSLIDCNNSTLMQIVSVRTAISTELRSALNSGIINESKVILLGREYGALDGELSYKCVTTFTQIANTLTSNQKNEIVLLRNALTNSSTKDGTIYLYSDLVDQPSIENTDFFFFTTSQIALTPTPTEVRFSPNLSSSPMASNSTNLQNTNYQAITIFVVITVIFAIIGAIAIFELKKLMKTSMNTKKIREES